MNEKLAVLTHYISLPSKQSPVPRTIPCTMTDPQHAVSVRLSIRHSRMEYSLMGCLFPILIPCPLGSLKTENCSMYCLTQGA